jgi:hypothetical protein
MEFWSLCYNRAFHRSFNEEFNGTAGFAGQDLEYQKGNQGDIWLVLEYHRVIISKTGAREFSI